MESAEIAIIGGTGVADPKMFADAKDVKVDTPYGNPSDSVSIGKFSGRKIAILSRHGRGHTKAPHLINYQANIWALKELGVKWVLAPCAVGSLQENIHAGEFVFVDQFIDRTQARKSTFYEGDTVCHISAADPVCPTLGELLKKSADKLKLKYHPRGTYICMEGPRFSTRAESHLYQSWGASVIGMTMVPECVLAREAEMCYASIAMVTDYDCWKEHNVNIKEIVATMTANIKKVKNLLTDVVEKIPKTRNCSCANALEGALI
ncbi:MAG: S-methyl-5'-thioadenosine phosphorylase [Candidatus Altiarchaeota archaeon]